jgi:hypothetical protein
MPYVGRTIGGSFPQSFSQYATHSEKYRRVPDAIRELLLEYWAQDGASLKDYRDLSHHYAIVSSEVRVVGLATDVTPRNWAI